MKTRMSRFMLIAGFCSLPFTAGATVITGSFTGYIEENAGEEVSGSLRLSLSNAPDDSVANPAQSEFVSSLEWVSLSLDGFSFGLPQDLSGYLTQDIVSMSNEGSKDVLVVQDFLRESESINAAVYLEQRLRISSEVLAFLATDTLEQTISWSDSEPGEVDENYGVFDYRYLWRDDELGIREVEEGSVVLTSFNFAQEVHSVSEPSTGLLLMSGLLGLGVARQRRQAHNKPSN